MSSLLQRALSLTPLETFVLRATWHSTGVLVALWALGFFR